MLYTVLVLMSGKFADESERGKIVPIRTGFSFEKFVSSATTAIFR